MAGEDGGGGEGEAADDCTRDVHTKLDDVGVGAGEDEEDEDDVVCERKSRGKRRPEKSTLVEGVMMRRQRTTGTMGTGR